MVERAPGLFFFGKNMIETKIRTGIHQETDPLKTVVIYGPPSVEALLAQFYPTEISLFTGQMDVMKARSEVRSFIGVLEQNGVEVIQAKDFFATDCQTQILRRKQILDELFAKAQMVGKQYGQDVPYWQDTLVELVDQEIETHGNDAALGLIRRTCLTPRVPHANIMYARDTMNMIGGDLVISQMAKTIRQDEEKLYRKFYQDHLGLTPSFNIPTGETFEGGDAYLHNNALWIGTSARTTTEAGLFIFRNTAQNLPGHDFILVNDPNWQHRSHEEQQTNMHLDTFSMPAGERDIVICEEEGLRRRINIFDPRKNELRFNKSSFISYLETRGQNVLVIPRSEQENYSCNFLMLNRNTGIIPMADNPYTIDLLEKAGKKLILVDLSECSKGSGTAHCMIAQLLRSYF